MGLATCQSPSVLFSNLSKSFCLSLKRQHLIQPIRKPVQQGQGQAQGWAVGLQHSLDEIPGNLVHTISWTPLPGHRPMLTTVQEMRGGERATRAQCLRRSIPADPALLSCHTSRSQGWHSLSLMLREGELASVITSGHRVGNEA